MPSQDHDPSPAGEVTPNAQQTWRHTEDGTDYVLLGRTTGSWILTPADPHQGSHRDVPLDEFADRYTYVSCNHDTACCPTHRTHTSPHRACMLR